MPATWLPQERETWSHAASPTSPPEGWAAAIAAVREGAARGQLGAQLAAFGPEQDVLRLLTWWAPRFEGARAMARVFVARFEDAALPALQRMHFTRRAALALPFEDGDTADFMIGAVARMRAIRKPAQEWLNRHGDYAVRHIVGLAPEQRSGAVPALRYLAAAGNISAESAAAVAEILRDAALTKLPNSRLPGWVDAEAMPTVALTPEEIGRVVRALMRSTPELPHPALAEAAESHDPATLAELVWVLFLAWKEAEWPSKHRWVFDALGLLGDDGTVARLAAELPTWPLGKSQHKAYAALDALATLGSPAALATLHELSRRFRAVSVREYAVRKLAECADAEGLTAEELADRLVPDLGLDKAGTRVLDFGARRFTVGLDESLEVRITDEEGHRLKTLPKPNAKDDADLAQAATEQFSALRKELRRVTDEELGRLEYALSSRRRWSPEGFEVLLGHPLLRALARRLVWAVYGDDGCTAFRVAEDLTFADVHDDAFEIPEDARLGVAHPLDLGRDLQAWSGLFDDYRIPQPFPQLGRTVFTLTHAEREANAFLRFQGITVPPNRITLLERRGWKHGPRSDDSGWDSLEWPVEDGLTVLVRMSPGFESIRVDSRHQLLEHVWVHRDGTDRWRPPADAPPLRVLDAVTVSEVLRDLDAATAAPGQ